MIEIRILYINLYFTNKWGNIQENNITKEQEDKKLKVNPITSKKST